MSGAAGAAGVGGNTGVAGNTGAAGAGGANIGSAGSGQGGSNAGTGGVSGAAGAGGTSAGGATGSCPVISSFASWPTGKGPADIGKAAVTNFLPHTGDAFSGAGYAWTFAYVASLQFTQLTNDTTNNAYLVSHFDCGQAGPDNSATATVDTRAFGDLPLEIFIEKGTAACKTLGMARADAQWANTADTAITRDARYWSDDMFMITGLQDFGYRATKTQKFLDRTALTMVSYLQALQQSDGLFWHTRQTMAKWGRANGWFAAGMALLLQDLPAGTSRDTIMAGYKKMMDGLLPVQITSGADAGAWRQVLDRTDAGVESSCTAMFTFALVTGLKNGWISGAQYETAAKNGWTALGNKTNSSGQLSQVCPGTGQAFGQPGVGTDLKSQQDFYIKLQSTFAAGDQHGQAPLLWSAIALLRSDCPGAGP
jgi:rhamnogalacturonyl hydrolase YesR